MKIKNEEDYVGRKIMKDAFPYLGSNIKSLREAIGISQSKMAEDLSIAKNAISQYESNSQIPERNILLLIAKYFKITENELLYSDLSNIDKLYDSKIENIDIQKDFFDKFFPIIVTKAALKNANFKMAYEKQKKIYESFMNKLQNQTMLNDEEFEKMYEGIAKYTNIYVKACEEGVIESAANILWWIMIEGYLYYIMTPSVTNELLEYGKLETKHFFELVGLNKPDIANINKAEKEIYEKEKRKYIKDSEKIFFNNIAKLKQTKDYSDLADHYISLRYMCGLYDNSLTDELNSTIGREMAETFKIIGNKYIREYSKILESN